MVWTDERIEELKVLWAEGLTTGEIGKRLGVSKNAVVGKAHRLGLKGRPSPIKRNGEATTAAAAPPAEATPVAATAPPPAAKAPAAPKPKAKPAAKDKKPQKIRSVVDLSANTCRWPIGDPKDANFHFCGASAMPGKPYCAEHAAIAYVGSNSSKQSREEDAA